MPKNSRPDIQVLEARVLRLKNQLLEYKGIRTYEITKQRLANVALELSECVSLITEITGTDRTTTPHIVVKDLKSDDVNSDEFNDDGDLADVLFTDADDFEGSGGISEKYTPKFIIKMYATQLQLCADTPTGIIQFNQMCFLLNSWFKARFIPETRNPNFRYKADRIHEWVDLIILAGCKALHEDKFSEFISYMDQWIEDLNTSKDGSWLLPLKVRQIEGTIGAYTKEAILAEKVIKTILYNSEFYPDEKDSICKIVIKNEGYTSQELTIESLIESCPHLIPTSSFDAKRYS